MIWMILAVMAGWAALFALVHQLPFEWQLLLAVAGFGLLALRCALGLLAAVADLIGRR